LADETIRLLMIEDDLVDRMAFERMVKAEGLPYEYTCVSSVGAGREALQSNKYDVVISDFRLGDGTAFDLIDEVASDVPLILVTGAGGEEVAVKAMKAGASDYLMKDVGGSYLKTLPITVANTIKAKATERELKRYHERLEALVEELSSTNKQLLEQIQHRKRAEEELRESMETSANIVETIPSGLLTFQYQPPGEFFLVAGNPEAERLLGIKVEQWHGQEIDEIWPNARLHGITQGLLKTIQTGERFKLDEAVYKKSDVTRFFRLRAFRIPGELLGVAFEDVTERTEAELALRAAHEELEARVNERTEALTRKNLELEEEIGKRERAEALLLRASRLGAMVRMAGGVADNFMNFLLTISRKADDALARVEASNLSDAKTLLKQILETAGQGTQTASHLRMFARAGAQEGQSPTSEIFDLTAAVREALQICDFWLKSKADEDGIDVSLELELTDDCPIDGERAEIVEVVVNLLRNALEALPKGGRIRVRTLREDNLSVLWVEDNGVGIPQPDMTKIFEPFWTSKESHTGLGLTTSFGIIHRHRGTIRVNSLLGKGTKVRVRFGQVGSFV
jgi:signal transduction histidine kinase/FixJ family two-component response regulator